MKRNKGTFKLWKLKFYKRKKKKKRLSDFVADVSDFARSFKVRLFVEAALNRFGAVEEGKCPFCNYM